MSERFSFAWPLESARSPADVVRLFRDRDRLVGLIGSWAGGGAVVAFDPTMRSGDVDVLRDNPPADVTTAVAPRVGAAWLGVLGYQLGRSIEQLPPPPRRPDPRPDCDLAYYQAVLRFDEETKLWWFEGMCEVAELHRLRARYREVRHRLRTATSDETAPHAFVAGAFRPTPTLDAHAGNIRTVLDHIAEGDIFQANVCLRLDASFEGDPLDAFLAGVDALAPAYAAFIKCDGGAVASLSPELFLRRHERHVLTAPIKGTAPLGSPAEDLSGSRKNRAENVMIVDLMRNDLGRVSIAGSVTVPRSLSVQRHTGVLHLVSEVASELCDGVDDTDLIRATFPPGSVTGAPKVRAMEIINSVEPTAREGYTGAVGWAGAGGLELNVAIRTLEFADRHLWLGVGGGIVADSDPGEEVAECLLKAAPLLAAIGAQLAIDEPAASPGTSIASGDRPASARPRGPTAGRCTVTDDLVVLERGPDEHRSTYEAVLWRLTEQGLPVEQRRPHQGEVTTETEVFDLIPGPAGGLAVPADRSPGPLLSWLVGADRSQLRTQIAPPSGSRPSVLIIDNYDSFTFNLAQYCQTGGAAVEVVRNDALPVAEIVRQVRNSRFDRIVISPGPGGPSEAGISVDLLRSLPDTTPVLGVCLGHQAIAAAFGGAVIRSPRPVHGREVVVHHDGRGIFAGLDGPFIGARYHSLVVDEQSLSATDLRVSARTPSGLVMALRHRRRPVEGVQIHPESVLTPHGQELIDRFLTCAAARTSKEESPREGTWLAVRR